MTTPMRVRRSVAATVRDGGEVRRRASARATRERSFVVGRSVETTPDRDRGRCNRRAFDRVEWLLDCPLAVAVRACVDACARERVCAWTDGVFCRRRRRRRVDVCVDSSAGLERRLVEYIICVGDSCRRRFDSRRHGRLG